MPNNGILLFEVTGKCTGGKRTNGYKNPLKSQLFRGRILLVGFSQYSELILAIAL